MSTMAQKAKVLNQQLAAELKNLRHEQCLTMTELAERLGRPHSFICKMEQKGRRLDIAEFVLYCEGLELDPVDAFSRMVKSTRCG